MRRSTIRSVLAAATGLGALVFAVSSSASVHPLSGNLRFQTGAGLAIPITVAPAPTGGVLATPAATVSVTSGTIGGTPPAIVFGGGELQRAPVTVVVPYFATNPAIFQIQTSHGVTYPNLPGTLAAGGRTGAATVHYCPGQVVTPLGNPNCASPNAGPGIHGLLIYSSTTSQFGGALSGRIFGGAQLAFGVGLGAPCSGAGCLVAMVQSSPNSVGTGKPGSGFGGSQMSPNPGLLSAFLTGMVTPGGLVTSATPTVLMATGPANPITGAGGPWTTGMVTVSVTAALGGAQIFVLTGSDNRVNGSGSISLVAGGVTNRALAGPNAQRGWLNLVVPEASPFIGAVAVLGALLATHGLVVRLRR